MSNFGHGVFCSPLFNSSRTAHASCIPGKISTDIWEAIRFDVRQNSGILAPQPSYYSSAFSSRFFLIDSPQITDRNIRRNESALDSHALYPISMQQGCAFWFRIILSKFLGPSKFGACRSTHLCTDRNTFCKVESHVMLCL